MSKRKKIPLGGLLFYLLTVLIFITVVPSLCLRLFPDLSSHQPLPEKADLTLPAEVKVYRTEKQKTETIPFETYITGVVAAEMPSEFDFEALKAQSVASRTYALGKILAGAKLCDTVHCQVYRSDNIPAKVSRAVKATKGQVLTYDGKLAAQALYFSSSAGPTENAEDVFSNPYPYLVSVSSNDETGATHKKEVLSLSLDDFLSQLESTFPELSFGKVSPRRIKILARTAGGRVDTLRVGEQVLSGADLRRAFSLYSTRFTLSIKNDTLTITTSGSGHGVGMSQYGANGMAKKGKTYGEILAHYYQGTLVSQGQ